MRIKSLIIFTLSIIACGFNASRETDYPPAQIEKAGDQLIITAKGIRRSFPKSQIQLHCVWGKSVTILNGSQQVLVIKDHARVSTPVSTSLDDLCFKLTPLVVR